MYIQNERQKYQNAIRGGMYGGAVGDALGYPIEFRSIEEIRIEYGDEGVRSYIIDKTTGKALISDDTQMSLFTANGILVGDTRGHLRGIQAAPSQYVKLAYRDWCTTQFSKFKEKNGESISWLLELPELYHQRAPGNTCLKALLSGEYGTMEEPLNDSKGCGGVMRVAPLGLHYNQLAPEELVKEGAAIAALTHGHPLGYISAGMLSVILQYAVYARDEYQSMRKLFLDALEVTERVFGNNAYFEELKTKVLRAMELAENTDGDIQNIAKLGQGWVAEETLAIAIYCCLRHENSFEQGIAAAVNHSGDSDSTGAVTGNILGTWLGYERIEDRWKHQLELSMIILEIADDLCYGCSMYEYETYWDDVWLEKYVDRKHT